VSEPGLSGMADPSLLALHRWIEYRIERARNTLEDTASLGDQAAIVSEAGGIKALRTLLAKVEHERKRRKEDA
jgi:hypothetical protein